jgi:hypothetical protein
MKSLQNDQVAIAGLEVEITDLKRAAGYILDMVVPQTDEEEPKSLLDDRLIVALERVTDFLKSSSKTTSVGALVRVKSHYPEVEVANIQAGPNKEANLKAIEPKVQTVVDKVVEDIDFEGEEEYSCCSHLSIASLLARAQQSCVVYKMMYFPFIMQYFYAHTNLISQKLFVLFRPAVDGRFWYT